MRKRTIPIVIGAIAHAIFSCAVHGQSRPRELLPDQDTSTRNGIRLGIAHAEADKPITFTLIAPTKANFRVVVKLTIAGKNKTDVDLSLDVRVDVQNNGSFAVFEASPELAKRSTIDVSIVDETPGATSDRVSTYQLSVEKWLIFDEKTAHNSKQR